MVVIGPCVGASAIASSSPGVLSVSFKLDSTMNVEIILAPSTARIIVMYFQLDVHWFVCPQRYANMRREGEILK